MAARVRAELSAQHGHEFRTHQTAFMMALLRPGIGKEYIHTGEASCSLPNGSFLHWLLIPKGLREHDLRIDKCTMCIRERL